MWQLYQCQVCQVVFNNSPITLDGALMCQTCGLSHYEAMQIPTQPALSIPASNAAQLPPQPPTPPQHVSSQEPVGVSLWKCQQCQYEYNQREDATCQRCSAPSSRPPSYHHRDEEKRWNCKRCGFAGNAAKVCGQCGGAQEAGKWLCVVCMQENSGKDQFCYCCGAEKEHGEDVKLTLVGNKWSCRCGSLTPAVLTTCQHCGFYSREIDLLKDAFGLK